MKRCTTACYLEKNYLASAINLIEGLNMGSIKAVLEALDVPVLILDNLRRIVCVVKPSCFPSFISAESCIGHHISEILLPKDIAEAILQNTKMVELSGEPREASCQVTDSLGKKSFSFRISPVIENGAKHGFVIACKSITARKEMEDAYKEQKKLLQLIENSITRIAAISSPDDRASAKDLSFENFPEHKTIANEYSQHHKGGSRVYSDGQKKVVNNENNNSDCAEVTARDIAAKREIEAAVCTSDENYRMLAENVMDMITLHKPNGQIKYASPSTFQTLGYSWPELKQMDLETFIHPEDYTRLRDEYNIEKLDGVDKLAIEYRVKNKAGQWLYIGSHVTIIRNEKRSVVKLLATSRDITDKKMTEIALRESEEKYERLTENSSFIVTLIKPDGEIMYANKLAAQYIKRAGCKYEPGMNMSHVVHGIRGRYVQAKIGRSIVNNTTDSFKTFFWLDNERLWLEIVIQPVLDTNGNPYAAMLNVFDLTDARHNEELLELQNEELKSIAFMQSHMVRAPLTNIMGLLDVINKEELGADNRFYVEVLEKVAGDLDNVIKEIVRKATRKTAQLER